MDTDSLLQLARSPPEPHSNPEYAAMGMTIAPMGEPGSSPTTRDALPSALCLSGLNLTRLPKDFARQGTWGTVTTLDLSGNRLQAFELGPGFSGLRTLGLDSNCLTALSRLALPELRDLAVHDNKLQRIESLDGLPQLTQLRLDRNCDLVTLPELPSSLHTVHLEGCVGLDQEQLLQQLLSVPSLKDVQLPWPDAEGSVQQNVCSEQEEMAAWLQNQLGAAVVEEAVVEEGGHNPFSAIASSGEAAH